MIELRDLPSLIRSSIEETDDLDTHIRTVHPTSIDLEAHSNIVEGIFLKQIFTQGSYTYAAMGDGVRIFDNTTDTEVYYKYLPDSNIRTVWGNNETLYLGSTIGLLQIDYTDLHADYENSVIENSFLLDAEVVNCIHGKDKRLLITTTSGVEYIDYTSNPVIRSKAPIGNTGKCFLTEKSAYYVNYEIVPGGISYSINRQDKYRWDWNTHSVSYTTGSGIIMSNIRITDLYVTENTANNGGNTLFFTTTSGAYVIDEDTLNYKVYYILQ